MKLQTPLQGILFDFDGLILDTEMPIYLAWKEKFSEQGWKLPLDDWAEILGKASHEMDRILDQVVQLHDPASRREFIEQVSSREKELVAEQAPLPGAVELIQKANREGLLLGVVSSSDQNWVHSHLDRLGLLEYFHHTSCADDVEAAKPDPALYHLGLKKMGAEPDRVVVLEDSPNGVLAAKRAGLYCIAVPNELTSQLPFFENGGQPDQVLNSLEDFPWQELMRNR